MITCPISQALFHDGSLLQCGLHCALCSMQALISIYSATVKFIKMHALKLGPIQEDVITEEYVLLRQNMNNKA